MPDDIPYEVEIEVTARVDALRAAMVTDRGIMADKLLRAMDILDAMDKRHHALEARHKALSGDHAALLLRVDELAARFETLTSAIQARAP